MTFVDPPLDVLYYMGTMYPNPPCWYLVSHVINKETGYITEDFTPEMDVIAIARAFREAIHNAHKWAEQIDSPSHLCIVLMARTEKRGIHHAGIFHHGHVLHALPTGIVNQSLSQIKQEYQTVQFWKIRT